MNKPKAVRPKLTPRVNSLSHSAIDILGDIHGCTEETVALLEALGHGVVFPKDPNEPASVTMAEGRTIAFAGDITDRGPSSLNTLRLLEGTLNAGGVCVMGNHDSKLLRCLWGNPVAKENGLSTTLEEIARVTPETRSRWATLLHALPHQIRFPETRISQDGMGTLVHGAAPEHHQDQETPNSLNRALYGYANGDTDENGYLIRLDWAHTYKGPRAVFHGHTPIKTVQAKNRVVCLDTGSVFGGKLTAYAVDTGVVTQIGSRVYAKIRPNVTQADLSPGALRAYTLEFDEPMNAPSMALANPSGNLGQNR